jgi:hypothetical protein
MATVMLVHMLYLLFGIVRPPYACSSWISIPIGFIKKKGLEPNKDSGTICVLQILGFFTLWLQSVQKHVSRVDVHMVASWIFDWNNQLYTAG